ncbi:MAG: ATP-binding protein [Planctomycetota bacterium]|nr:ATP-binding protein [Planctomycetota bacterium]
MRFKLVATSIVATAVIFVVAGLTALVVHERYVRRDFDNRLAQRAAALIDNVNEFEAPFTREIIGGAIRNSAGADYFKDYYLQAREIDGRVIQRSPNLGQANLPFDARAGAGRPGRPYFSTFTADDVAGLTGAAGNYRLVSIYHPGRRTRPFLLEAATSLGHVERSLATMRLVFGLGLPAALLVVGLVSWVVLGIGLKRLDLVTRQAERLDASELNRRIHVPGDDEVGALRDVMNSMLDRLESSFQAHQRFIADVSHELRTPISVILSEAQLLRRSHSDSIERHREFTHSVEEEMKRLGRLVESFLALARAESHQDPARFIDVSLNDLAIQSAANNESLARPAKVEVHPVLAALEEDHAPLPTVRGDEDLLQCMLDNLVRNAIRFSPAGGRVDVHVETRNGHALLRVCDQGPGLPAEYQSAIFDRLVQVGPGLGPRRGYGLGLAIAKGVATLHGGAIRASNLDRGCEFVVELPIHSDD